MPKTYYVCNDGMYFGPFTYSVASALAAECNGTIEELQVSKAS